MKKAKSVFWLLVCGVMICMQGCATGSSTFSPAFQAVSLDRIAVVEVSGDIQGQAPKNQVEDFFAMELLRKGYRVIERTRVESILEEQDFQHSEFTSSEAAIEKGRILNVAAVVMLDVAVAGEGVTVTGRMLDPETGEILWMGTGSGGTRKTLATVVGAAAGAMGGHQVRGRSRTLATITGGVLGGAAGHALAPEIAQVVQNAVREMVRDLPQR